MKSEKRHSLILLFAVLRRDVLHLVQDFSVRIAEIIDNNDIVSFLQQLQGGMTTNVAQPSNNEDIGLVMMRQVQRLNWQVVEQS